MKLIWLSHFVPFPPRGEDLQRSFNPIGHVSKSYEISLIALNLLGESRQQPRMYEAGMKQYCQGAEICELPYPWRGGRWWAEAMCSPLFSALFSEGHRCSRSSSRGGHLRAGGTGSGRNGGNRGWPGYRGVNAACVVVAREFTASRAATVAQLYESLSEAG